MRYGIEQSDSALVAMKSTNKDLSGPAELMERRAGAEGNPSGPSPRRAQDGSLEHFWQRPREFRGLRAVMVSISVLEGPVSG